MTADESFRREKVFFRHSDRKIARVDNAESDGASSSAVYGNATFAFDWLRNRSRSVSPLTSSPMKRT